MAKPKGYKKLSVVCLLVFILCADTSFAGRGGPSGGRGGASFTARGAGRGGSSAGGRGTSFAGRGAGRRGSSAGWGGTSFTKRGAGRGGPSTGCRDTSFTKRDAKRCGPSVCRKDTSFAKRDAKRCGPSVCRKDPSFAKRAVNRCAPSAGRVITCLQRQPVIIGLSYGYAYYDYSRCRYSDLDPPPEEQYLPPQGDNTYNYFSGTEYSAAQNYSSTYRRQLPQKTEVGIYYGDGVAAFKDGDYAEAAKNFQRAIRPANKFMPLAYTQALFADKNYAQAAEQLRLALDRFSPENNSLLFPRFLYPSDQILLTQIEKLRGQAGSNSDLQLLVGYQLFGVKKMDEAVKFLNKAKSNSVNEPAATKLLLMIEKT